MTTEFWVGILLAVAANVAALATAWGGFSARLKSLEQKVDKHNHIVERMYQCEARLNSHDRDIDGLKGE